MLIKLAVMSQAGLNLKYLRKLRGWTQEEFAMKLGIKRSLIGAYEEERADPRLDVLETVADIFKLTLDELLLKELNNQAGNYLQKRRQQKMASADRNLIHFVPVKAAAGYLTSYADSEFIDELNTFTLPMLSGGHYRAFEIIGDSMMPTPSGSVIVGEKINGIDDVKNNMAYIVVSRNEGIVCKIFKLYDMLLNECCIADIYSSVKGCITHKNHIIGYIRVVILEHISIVEVVVIVCL